MRIDRRNDLSLRHLEVFGAVMEHRTTVGAAEHLGISQPAVSNAIRALERQLGLALFERIGRRLRPTEEALLLVQESEPIFAMLRALEEEVRDLKHARTGRLRIAATPPLGHTVLPHALREVLAGRDRMQLRYSVQRIGLVLQAVESGAADLGVFLGPLQNPGLTSHLLTEAELVAVVPRDHPLAARAVLTPSDLADHPLIGLETTIGKQVTAAFATAGVPYLPRIETRYGQTACALVNAGLGVSVVDPYTAAAASGLAVVARRFAPVSRIAVIAVTRSGNSATSLAAQVIETLRRRLHATPPLPRL
ncbi:LysR family transcriptional regulator [Plastorhodobacter daqingensis]|uniref:LysR family transcriptional regulator n=1 Tax=Plastorhodobacter daqingensis TaxID=1387281 RepID=A0ABW2UJ83_9RHOB